MFIILMRRIAAHYVWCKQVYRMHYIELDDNGAFHGVYPLNEEIAGTAWRLRNSAQTTAVAMATLRDSEVSLPSG